ncbi:MAG: hypothetical protein HYT28_02450 [Parcubacteria group bacterium]|nr:hypothetical protein [Parcubacteria group bacterium]
MSTENPQQNELADQMKLFREKVHLLIKDERALKKTAHFSSIDNVQEFLGLLNEEDMKWLDFVEEGQRAMKKEEIHHLSAAQIDEYKAKIEEFKNARGNFQGLRSIWYEFLANKLNIALLKFKLSILEKKRGKSDFNKIPP